MSACCCCRSPRCGRSAPLPDGFTLAHYARVFGESSRLHQATRCSTAALAGADRRRARRRHRLSGAAHAAARPQRARLGRVGAALAVPGIVLGIGYLRAFYGVKLPDGKPLATFWIMIVLALRDPPPALCAARLPTRRCSRSRCRWRKPPKTSAPPSSRTVRAHRRAADDRRHPGRLRHQLRHRRGRAVGDADAGAVAIPTRRWPTASMSDADRRPAAAPARRSASSPWSRRGLHRACRISSSSATQRASAGLDELSTAAMSTSTAVGIESQRQPVLRRQRTS